MNLNFQMAIFSPVSKDVGCLHVVLKDATVPGAGCEGNLSLPKAICTTVAHVKRNKRYFILESNINDHGPGTYIDAGCPE